VKVAVTGARGLVGSALLPALRDAGHEVVRLVRYPPEAPDEVHWDPDEARIDADALRGINAAVHLAGENIAAGRWTARQRQRIRESRVLGTGLLAETLAELDPRPAVLICASAVGYYGSRGAETLTEESDSGRGFFPQVVIEWEAAAEPAAEAGIRLVHLRFGVIVSVDGGLLPGILPLFRRGLGATFGNGRQFMPWIALDDAVGTILFALANRALREPVNAVAPNPVTNAQFTTALARAVGRRAFLRIPTFAVKLLLGQMGTELLLPSTRAVPELLQSAGFKFRYPDLDAALEHTLAGR